MDEERYATEGTLFFCNVMDHMECLIGLPKDAYIELMACGFGAEEVGLNIRKTDDGGGFFAGVAGLRMWGEILNIKMDGEDKYQVRVSGAEADHLRSAGYRDLESVRVGFTKLPHTRPSRELRPEDFTLDFGLE